MSIEVRWANPEKTLLTYEVHGQWTWAELQRILEKAHAMLDEADGPTPIIADFRDSRFMPDRAMWRGSRIAKGRHPNTGKTIYVGASRFMNVLFDAFKRIYPDLARIVVFVDTIEEAYALLQDDINADYRVA